MFEVQAHKLLSSLAERALELKEKLAVQMLHDHQQINERFLKGFHCFPSSSFVFEHQILPNIVGLVSSGNISALWELKIAYMKLLSKI